MKIKSKVIISLILIGIGTLPTLAKVTGRVSQDLFYDTESTIMTEIEPNTTIRASKYWEKNLLHFNKYRPIFMLSNKELFKLMPEEKVSVVQRISTPSVYNISLKTASIKTVSLNSKPAVYSKNTQTKQQKNEAQDAYQLIFESAKGLDIDTDKKIEAAIELKNAQKSSYSHLALELLDEVTKIEPFNAYAFYLKGEIYSQQNSPKSALKNYIQALRINPASKQSCLGIAKVLEPTNKQLAQKYYERAR